MRNYVSLALTVSRWARSFLLYRRFRTDCRWATTQEDCVRATGWDPMARTATARLARAMPCEFAHASSYKTQLLAPGFADKAVHRSRVPVAMRQLGTIDTATRKISRSTNLVSCANTGLDFSAAVLAKLTPARPESVTVRRRQEMFEQLDMPDAQFMEEMDAMIPDMYDVPGGSPPSEPEHGSLPPSNGGAGSGGQPGGGPADAEVQPGAAEQALCSLLWSFRWSSH